MSSKTKQRWIPSLLLLAILTLSLPGQSQPLPGKAGEPLIIGHMGAPYEAIENTLPSFQAALDRGANAIETDLCMTSDGYVVLWHDWDPDGPIALIRQLGKQGLKARPSVPDLGSRFRVLVGKMTLANLRKYCGYAKRESPVGSPSPLPATIPTFDEFCTWAAGQPKLKRFFLDVKLTKKYAPWAGPLVQRCLASMRRAGLPDEKAVFMIPIPEVLEAAMAKVDTAKVNLDWDQELPPGLIIRPSKFSAAKPALERKLRWTSIGRPVATMLGYTIFKKIIKGDLQQIRSSRQPFEGYVAWTIDDKKEIRDMLLMGVRAIVTNRPERVREVLSSLQQKK